MYFQPIENDDPRLDFYTMYKRETTEYDADHMDKYDEDLNTTLIFVRFCVPCIAVSVDRTTQAGLFSAVSSAFVIDVQSKLEPDSGERSEAYLRAILLSINQSVSPGEVPAPPPTWGGPRREIITTLDLLYASLLMSLLAAFVAMLGKQWVKRYLRHTGGSIVERSGDRQRKSDGLERWPFRTIIEGLPVILQIALLFLACGLSRYVWSVNTSVARIVISFTVLGVLFYVGIVVAGIPSHECPFQTPASKTLRHLRDSRTTRKLFASLSLTKVVSLIHIAWAITQQGLVSLSRRVYNTLRHPSSWRVSPSRVMSGVHGAATMVGHQTVILFLRIDRGLGNGKRRLVHGIRRFGRVGLLPIAVGDAHHQPLASRTGPGLLVRARNMEALRKLNADNTRCVSWVLRNITDPEAIDSAIRLANTVRWFDGDSYPEPPFDLMVSIFEACFDSTPQVYPGMEKRAYFSARAILQIKASATARSHELASKYPIPSAYPERVELDLHNIIHELEDGSDDRSAPYFPTGGANAHTHLLWMSNSLQDLTGEGPHPSPFLCWSCFNTAPANRERTITDTLVAWCMFLGGHIEEETFWTADKSYALIHHPSLQATQNYASLDVILSHLSTRVMDAIADGNRLGYLLYLLAYWRDGRSNAGV